jgi:uncharacterized protein (DUF302 family)
MPIRFGGGTLSIALPLKILVTSHRDRTASAYATNRMTAPANSGGSSVAT